MLPSKFTLFSATATTTPTPITGIFLEKDCEPKSSLGPFVHIKSRHDPWLFPPLPKESRQFKRIYKQRSASERINFINDSYKLDKTRRNADYGLIRLTLSNIAHHAVVGYRKAKESGDDFNLSAFMASGVIPEAEPAPG